MDRPALHGFVLDAAEPYHPEVGRLRRYTVLRDKEHDDASEEDDHARKAEREQQADGHVLADAHVRHYASSAPDPQDELRITRDDSA